MNSSTVTTDLQLNYNFDILEDKSRKILHKSVGNHILEWMVSKDSKAEGKLFCTEQCKVIARAYQAIKAVNAPLVTQIKAWQSEAGRLGTLSVNL